MSCRKLLPLSYHPQWYSSRLCQWVPSWWTLGSAWGAGNGSVLPHRVTDLCNSLKVYENVAQCLNFGILGGANWPLFALQQCCHCHKCLHCSTWNHLLSGQTVSKYRLIDRLFMHLFLISLTNIWRLLILLLEENLSPRLELLWSWECGCMYLFAIDGFLKCIEAFLWSPLILHDIDFPIDWKMDVENDDILNPRISDLCQQIHPLLRLSSSLDSCPQIRPAYLSITFSVLTMYTYTRKWRKLGW